MSLTKIKSSNITTTGVTAGSYTAADITVNSSGQVTSASSGTGGGGATVTILSVIVTSDTYANLDDTAVDISGGYIKIIGTGFASGCTVLVNNIPATSTTFIGPTEVRAQLPATAAGTYVLYVVNANGSVAIRVNGITFSATPSWINSSDLSSYPLNEAISIQLSATSATTYALQSGSSLPAGLTLSSSGLLSGTVTGLENDTSYSFAIIATDAELQDSPRTFTITIVVQVQVSRSLRFNATDTTYLSRTPATTTNRTTWTVSVWVKRAAIGSGQNIIRATDGTTNDTLLRFESNDSIGVYTNGTTNLNLITTAKYRDPSAWYHIVLAVDTTQSTPSNRALLYVNGTQVTAFTTETYVTQNTNTQFNTTSFVMNIGRYSGGGGLEYFSGYMAEFNFIDGQQLTPTAFALTNTTTGQYGPRKYMGSYGTNGFYLPFTDNSSVLNLGRNYEPLTADPLWPQTVLLLNGTGTNNANNNTFTDSSTNAFAITRNGNVSQGRFSPFTQGGWSNYFDGSGDSLSLVDNTAFRLGTNSFTMEGWIYLTAYSPLYFGSYYGVALCAKETAGSRSFYFTINATASSYTGLTLGLCSSGDTFTTTTGNFSFALNTWYHIAAVRNGTTATLYVNGTSIGSNTNSTNVNVSTTPLTIGQDGFGQFEYYLPGYISNFRLVNGVAVYTGNFTPPTTPLAATQSAGTNISALTGTQTTILTCQSNRFIDASSNGFTITRNGDTRVVAFSPFTPTTAYSAAANGGSGYFDGSGDYLTFTDSANNLDLGGVQASVDFWFYRTSAGTDLDDFIIKRGPGAGWNATDGIEYIIIQSSNQIVIYYNTGGSFATWNTGITVTNYQWNHLCVATNTSNNISVFLNGTTKATSTFSIAKPTTRTTVNIGVDSTTDANYFTGYMSGLRFLTGSNAFDPTASSITVPTAPPTVVTGTQLLLNYTSAGIVDATGDNNIETVGDAKISTAQSKWSGGSMAFDGTGDYLYSPSNNLYSFGTGDFTIEAWIYATTLTTKGVFQTSDNPGGLKTTYTSGLVLSTADAANGQLVLNVLGTNITTGSTYIAINTWYHVAVTRLAGNISIFLNGVLVGGPTSIASAINGSYLSVGGYYNTSYLWNGYISDFRITRAARYTGNFTPPTAQFAYNQSDINYKQWVPTNFSVTAGTGNDSLLDTPTNWGVDTGLGGEVRGNYCTLNPNIPPKNSGTASRTLANGNLDLAGVSGGWTVAGGTFRIFAGSGRWYFETTGGVASSTVVGFHKLTRGYFLDAILGYTDGADTEGYAYAMDGNKLNNGGSAYGASWTTSDVIGCAIDASAATASITFYKNGVSQGVAFSNLTGDFIPAVSIGGTGPVVCNFGQRPFAYAAPSGFKSLNTHNLPALAVVKSNTAFDAKLYTGNGTSLTVSEFGFSPDLVWIKGRSTAYSHYLFDTIRGATKMLYSESTSQEDTGATSLTAFTSNGFTVGTNIGVNNNATSHIAWAWDAGTTTVVNTAGSITANVRVNQSSGFSVVAYAITSASATISTFGHGLGVVPNMVILKVRNTVDDWTVYHSSIATPNSNWITLNSIAAAGGSTSTFSQSSTTFGVRETRLVGSGGSGNIIAYCFAAVPGFSAFGSYTGNGSADGPFVYTGFRPRFIMLKSSTVASTNWQINDTARDTYNVANKRLAPSAADAEATNFDFGDILSNGFKIRQTDQTWNSNGQTYIYAAFAEQPFKYSRAR